jgi:hypothetical protein
MPAPQHPDIQEEIGSALPDDGYSNAMSRCDTGSVAADNDSASAASMPIGQ